MTRGARKPTPQPLEVVRKPVEEPHATPKPGGLEGVDARWVRMNNEATLLLGEGEVERAVEMFAQCHAALPDRVVGVDAVIVPRQQDPD